jgi:ribosomal protein S18 acetylase RimI-like enzyme
MKDCIIREIKKNEIPLLSNFIYEAIFPRDEKNLLPFDVINEPNVKVYIENFGKSDDLCLVAEIEEKIVGAVWTRILSGEIKGHGNIDKNTPEFAISVYKDYRKKGIGTKLMKNMLRLLKDKGYTKTSLAVQKDNFATDMYKNVGFEIMKETEEEYIMVCDLNKC